MTLAFDRISNPEVARAAARPSRLMERIYRDVGLAAVARELELSADDLEPEVSEAVKRGVRFVYLTPKATHGVKSR